MLLLRLLLAPHIFAFPLSPHSCVLPLCPACCFSVSYFIIMLMIQLVRVQVSITVSILEPSLLFKIHFCWSGAGCHPFFRLIPLGLFFILLFILFMLIRLPYGVPFTTRYIPPPLGNSGYSLSDPDHEGGSISALFRPSGPFGASGGGLPLDF